MKRIKSIAYNSDWNSSFSSPKASSFHDSRDMAVSAGNENLLALLCDKDIGVHAEYVLTCSEVAGATSTSETPILLFHIERQIIPELVTAVTLRADPEYIITYSVQA